MVKTLIVCDCDGCLRDERFSYQRCISETVGFFDNGRNATQEEINESRGKTNDDWERTQDILHNRGLNVELEKVKNYFQDLYLGKDRKFTGYINDEKWLAINRLLSDMYERYPVAIVSGAPREEVLYALEKNKASSFFNYVIGMHDCENKKDGIEKAIELFGPQTILFCDDRKTPIEEAKQIKIVHPYGILPPDAEAGYGDMLKEAGAEKVFPNINKWFEWILSRKL